MRTEKVLYDEECFEIIRKKLKKDAMDDFSVIKYELIPMEEVRGYMGQYFTLKATVACPDSPQDTRHINFFTKVPPKSSSPQFEYAQEYGSFKKEVALYTKVFPEILKNFDHPPCEFIPDCFLGLENDVIVLEDMSFSGYKMTNKFVPFDLKHCEIVMKTLARFHSKSLIFEANCENNLYELYSSYMKETLWPCSSNDDDDNSNDRSTRMFNAAVKGVISLIGFTDLQDSKKDAFKEKVKSLTRNHTHQLAPSKLFKNVLCHGDLWANNILFKYDEDQKPIDCCLIDFQLVRYNPPAHDLLCFLQFTTTRELRKNHSKYLFDLYYDTMSSAMKESGLDVSLILPKEEFLESIKYLELMCMVHGVLNTPIMLLEPSAANKYFAEQPELLESMLYVDRTPLVANQFDEVPEYRERMIDALLELHDFLSDTK